MYSDRNERVDRVSERTAGRELRYALVGQSAWPVEHQGPVNILHHLLLIDTGHAVMPSPPFRSSLARLCSTTAIGQENQNPQNNSQNQLAREIGNASHHFSLSIGLRVVLPPQRHEIHP